MNLREIVKSKNTTIIDVRTNEEFSEGNVDNSINIPLHELSEKVDELKEIQPIVLCCRSGHRSGKAEVFLRSHGLDDVYNGGGWLEVISLLK